MLIEIIDIPLHVSRKVFNSLDRGSKFKIYKRFRKCPGHFPNISCTFNVHFVFKGKIIAACCFISHEKGVIN